MALQQHAFIAWHTAMRKGKHLAPWSVVVDADARERAIALLIDRDIELAGDSLSAMTLTLARRICGNDDDDDRASCAAVAAVELAIERMCAFCANTGAHPNDAVSSALATDGATLELDRRTLTRRIANLARVAPRTFFSSSTPKMFLTPVDPDACFRVGNEVLTLVAREPKLLLTESDVINAANEDVRATLTHRVGITTRLFQDALIAEEPWLLLPGGLSLTRTEMLADLWRERGGPQVEQQAQRQRNQGVRTREDDAEDQRWFTNAFCDGYG